MDCKTAQEWLGALLDGELSDQERLLLEKHLQACSSCDAEREQLQAMVHHLQTCDRHANVNAPTQLWSSIEKELDRPARELGRAERMFRLFRKPIAAAASLALVLGLGILFAAWVTESARPAQAAGVDYSILLNNLSGDVNAAFERFIQYYKAQPIDVADAQRAAPALSFSLPPELPGGYRLEQVYRLRFGTAPGVAAQYRRGDEPLMIFFHPPVDKERLGVHREQPCLVGHTHGHKVEVGAWRLVHFTDQTTCHCLLSTLNVESELPAVFAAVAPKFGGGEGGHGH
jgi:hypothetical protein